MLSTERRNLKQQQPGDVFPDQVVESAVAARPLLLRSWGHDCEAGASPRQFSLDEARDMIIGAFQAFSPEMGARAQAIFGAGFDSAPDIESVDFVSYKSDPITDDPSRWRIREIAPGADQSVMRAVPANAIENDTMPHNPHAHAVIQYEFDGTLNGVVYMAHEVGHAIADDMQPDNTLNPRHLTETQAYFAQHMAYDYLTRHQDGDVARSAAHHSNATMIGAFKDLDDDHYRENRPVPLVVSRVLYDRLQDADPSMRNRVADMLMGADGPKDISEILAASGIERRAELLRDIVSMAPLQAIADTAMHLQNGTEAQGQILPGTMNPD